MCVCLTCRTRSWWRSASGREGLGSCTTDRLNWCVVPQLGTRGTPGASSQTAMILLFLLALKLPSSGRLGKARLWVPFVFFHFYLISLWFRGWIGSMYLLISNYIQLTDYVLSVQFVVSVAMSNNRQTLVWRSKRAWASSLAINLQEWSPHPKGKDKKQTHVCLVKFGSDLVPVPRSNPQVW